jgi:sulfoxide reductase heme-binding subunit YedZ
MTQNALDPTQHIWWLASRASGIVALGLITASVALGLAMANKLWRGRNPAKLHEQLSLAGLVAIAIHGVTLLGDPWLHPGVSGIAVPFTMGYRTVFTGLGILGGYLAAALGLSFYLRRKIGAKLWRKLHRFTVVAYVLALVHTLGAGTDASSAWLRTFMLATALPIGVMFARRMIPRRTRAAARATAPAARGAEG